MSAMIEAKNITFAYENVKVLDGADLIVYKGDFIALIGENGSGKSTLVKLIAGMEKMQGGNIQILGKDKEQFKQWRKIGYVPQKANAFNLDFPATVEEIVGSNSYAGFGFFWSHNKEQKARVNKALEFVEMTDLRKRQIGKLSGGQQQRAFIARALVGSPEILLMDEPTVGIDAKTEEAVYCLLARLNQKLGITIVMVTHDISAVTAHANKIAFLSSGKVHLNTSMVDISNERVSDIYGHDVNVHLHQHDCSACSKWKEVL